MFKPNKEYELLQEYANYNDILYRFKVSENGKNVIITKSGCNWALNSIHLTRTFNYLAFRELKNKKNHLPEWL